MPRPALLSISMVPRCSSMMFLTIERPSPVPVPFRRVEKNGSKTRLSWRYSSGAKVRATVPSRVPSPRPYPACCASDLLRPDGGRAHPREHLVVRGRHRPKSVEEAATRRLGGRIERLAQGRPEPLLERPLQRAGTDPLEVQGDGAMLGRLVAARELQDEASDGDLSDHEVARGPHDDARIVPFEGALVHDSVGRLR